ncbi:MAG: DUF3307 domain-containing protein [Candidatus Aureabacteria bacterium]|nr:DUF3307 domain-containing protein [Candidatus Auribacterota bacterium]
MLLFKLLILAHLVADFPLQSAHIYRLKRRYLAGQIPHALICLGTMALAGYPLIGSWSFWRFISVVAGAHLMVDYVKVAFLDRLGPRNDLGTFLLDQAMHIAVIAAVFMTPLPGLPELQGGIIQRLDRAGVITTSIFFLVATFSGVYLLDSAKRTLLHAPEYALMPDGFSKYYGVVERGILFALMVGGYAYLALVPAVMLIRLPVANHCAKKFKPEKFLLSPADIAGSFLIACASAVCAVLTR